MYLFYLAIVVGVFFTYIAPPRPPLAVFRLNVQPLGYGTKMKWSIGAEIDEMCMDSQERDNDKR